MALTPSLTLGLIEYVYQIVVDKKYLTPEQLKTFETEEATVLEPWDPMGSLATLR